jgi:hypothetical protein
MKKYIPIFLVLVGLFVSNCIREDLDDCPRGKYICLKSAMYKYNIEDVAQEVLLYLYNNHGDLVDTFRFSAAYLTANNYTALLPIEDAGQYTLVALLNPSTQYYSVVGEETLTTFRTELKADRTDTIARKQSDLFYAHKEIAHTQSTKIEYDTLRFYKSTVHFDVYVQLDDYNLPPENTLTTAIDGNNGIFDYLNSKSARRLYLPYTTQLVTAQGAKVEYHYQFTTMDFRTTDALTLLVQEKGTLTDRTEIINIVESLKNVTLDNGTHPYDTNEGLAQEDEYNLTVVLDAGFKVLELRINDWYTVKGGLEL